jgi:hypothetical protein
MKHVCSSSAPGRAPWVSFTAFTGACLVLLAAGSAPEALAATPVQSPIRAAQLFAQAGGWASVSPRSTQAERE